MNETKTNDLYEGETKVTKQGVDGKQQLTVKQQLLDGKVVEEKVTAKKVLEKPVAQEVLVGTKKKPYSRAPAPASPFRQAMASSMTQTATRFPTQMYFTVPGQLTMRLRAR